MLNNFAKHLAKINENQPEILQKYIHIYYTINQSMKTKTTNS